MLFVYMAYRFRLALRLNKTRFLMSLYSRRGVSAQKEEVHQATAGLDKGLYPLCILQDI